MAEEGHKRPRVPGFEENYRAGQGRWSWAYVREVGEEGQERWPWAHARRKLGEEERWSWAHARKVVVEEGRWVWAVG